MKALGGLLIALSLAGCANFQRPTCPIGQEQLRTAQLFLGSSAVSTASEAELRKFVDQEITPRFPGGLTVLDGGGQWQGPENKLIREAAKVVLIVLPPSGEAQTRIEAVRTAYKTRFKQDSVMLVTQAACVAF